MTALVNNCPCARRMRIPFRADPLNPGRPAADTNVVCIFCERVLRVLVTRTPDRRSAQTEVRAAEIPDIDAAKARATAIRGEPVRDPPPPPRDPP